jgi:hypothetical protein
VARASRPRYAVYCTHGSHGNWVAKSVGGRLAVPFVVTEVGQALPLRRLTGGHRRASKRYIASCGCTGTICATRAMTFLFWAAFFRS